MSKLRLGAIVEEKPVKMTVELSGSLARSLAEYAEVHAASNGLQAPMPVERLLPAMAERFIATDRAFARLRRKD